MGVVGRVVRRRLADVGLFVTWVVVAFNLIQLTRIDDEESTTRILVSYAVMLAVGVAATVLWLRSRSRLRSTSSPRSP